ncbi:MAG: ribonuclease P protein component [Flavobacteriaceae bacterium]|nr:ribonuclease P protein component [Flavobacteriaceae bacterium]
MRYTFGSEEKLKSKKLIEQLFAEGRSISVYPIKLIYLEVAHQGNYPVQVGVSVSKRTIRKAVTRNRIKRLLRECYRKHKHLVYDQIEKKYIFMFLYLDENEQKYVVLEGKMVDLLKKFIKKTGKDD